MAKLDRFIIDDTTYELVPEIAPLFNPATPYSVGDCVIHDAVLYKFTANHAAGAWTGNDVEAFEVGRELVRIGNGSGLTESIKTALLACFEKVAWIDEDGQDYYDALYNALYPPEWGSDYTWLYKSSDGQLLSARTDIVTASIGTGCTETLENGLLKLFVPARTSQLIRFDLAQQSNAQGKLTAKVKFNSVGYASTGVGTGFRLQISNGTNGTQIFERCDEDSSTYTFGVYVGSAYSDKLAFELNTWHIISVERTSTGQVVSVDGVPILESASMSTYYCTKNSIITQNAPYSTVECNVNIAWITYKNND